MKRLAGALTLFLTLAVQGCLASTLVLHVMPDGSGQAVITTRMYESGITAFDSLFPERPAPPPKLEELLPPPDEAQLEGAFGSRVRIASTKLAKETDGGVRTTTVDFDDVTALHIPFPPILVLPGGMHGGFGMDGLKDPAVISFAMKPHENGDRLLLVRMPDNRLQPDPAEPVTTLKTDSPEERKLKLAVKHMALRFFVELEQPLLRTNAPAQQGNRATILDLDLDKLINGLDEDKVRAVMRPGSMQEMLWQLGDLPGAVVPTEHEVFLEFEAPKAPQQPPAPAVPPAAAPGPPDTEIYLAPMKTANGGIEIGAPVNITNNPGYDNQPFFTPDGKAILFTSIRGGSAAPAGASASQTDIYRYDIASKQVTQVTATPESEYSPTVTPAGNISVIRVELDGSNTQRLWQFTADGRDPRVVLEKVKPVGYHAWADDHTLALFVLGQPATLQLADTRTGAARTLASDIGRSIQRIPGRTAVSAISFVQRERTGDKTTLTIKALNPVSGEVEVLTPAVDGSTEADTAWTPDGTLLMAKGGVLYGWKRGQSGWKEISNLERLSLRGITRLAVSPKGDFLALVGAPREPR